MFSFASMHARQRMILYTLHGSFSSVLEDYREICLVRLLPILDNIPAFVLHYAYHEQKDVIGVYGKQETSPDFIPCLEKWFDCSPYRNRVLGIERHLHGQTMQDSILDVPEEKTRIRGFVLG